MMTILACKRQLKDMARKRFAYEFDVDEAERCVAFIETLPHVKGKFAADKRKLILEPWQKFFITTLFGWYHKKKGRRRFREAYLCVARKNGKSMLAAAIGLLMLIADGEFGAEVYSGATNEKQAYEVFRPAKQILRKFRDLRELAGADIMAHSISIPQDGSRFEALIGDPPDGQSPSCAIVDEYHEHPSTSLYDTMLTGMGSREQPLLLVTTTAGATIGGPCYTLQREHEKILAGVGKRRPVHEQKFILIYHAEEDDDWTDPAVLIKANPNLDRSTSKDFLIAMQQDAADSPAKQNVFRNKHLNQWTAAKHAFYNLVKWARCKNSQAKVENFLGESCIFSLDLSSKSDLTAYLKIFPVQKERIHYYVFPRFYLPEDKVHEDPTGKYLQWLTAGYLTVTDGNEIDMQVVERDVMADMALYDCMECVYDPWRAVELSRRLTDAGATMVEYRNTTARMSEPMKETEAAINGKRLHHDDNDVMNWCISNVISRTDANSNVFPRKETDESKIDGATALIMGTGRLMFREDLPTMSDWLNSSPITG